MDFNIFLSEFNKIQSILNIYLQLAGRICDFDSIKHFPKLLPFDNKKQGNHKPICAEGF
jgi:hypothetical protein